MSAGADDRPRSEYPMPWGAKYWSAKYVKDPTMAQLTSHVDDGLKFVAANRKSAETNMMILSAWNEVRARDAVPASVCHPPSPARALLLLLLLLLTTTPLLARRGALDRPRAREVRRRGEARGDQEGHRRRGGAAQGVLGGRGGRGVDLYERYQRSL